MNTKILGASGEQRAAEFLKEKGYKILGTNFSNKIGEIDIIAKDKEFVVFVEVKARSSKAFGLPSEAVNFHKQQKIRKVALSYLKSNKMLGKFNADLMLLKFWTIILDISKMLFKLNKN